MPVCHGFFSFFLLQDNFWAFVNYLMVFKSLPHSYECFFKKIIVFFIYFHLCWVFVAEHCISLAAGSRSTLSWWCAGFSLWWLSSCRAQALRALGTQQLWHTDLVALRHVGSSGSGIEHMSPALAGGLLTTGPPRKSPYESLRYCFIFYINRIALYIFFFYS